MIAEQDKEAVVALISDSGLFEYGGNLDKYKDLNDAHSNTLKLFAVGVYSDYATENRGNYIELDDKQLYKLRQLSLTAYAPDRIVSYDKVKAELDLPTDEAVEELFIAALNNNLISGKINQLKKTLTVHSNITRDVQSIDVHSLRDFLEQYSANVKQLLGNLNQIDINNTNHINSVNAVSTHHQHLFDKAVAQHKSQQTNKQPSSRKRNRIHQ
ncbi:hypothetical protein E3P99_02372 [Wallemia hederae]|uniref:PCI domain-containing protein n=1 Tax=Wallemia hederae TaxID=1540922 RepID=A0A4T0FKI4_9BASI|nr:hypothetical protein E3P99_02372 [Wallemia hederae]